MKYVSTRNKNLRFDSAQAIAAGIAPDGGLFVPETFPSLSEEEIEALCACDYPEREARVLSKYLDDFSYDELLEYADDACSRFYGDPCPLVTIDDGLYILELWHGPTAAFKDMALTMLPHLMGAARKKTGATEKTMILVATSGDTGKAALEGFKDVEGTAVAAFYPADGVSDMQKLQMITQEGANVAAFGIDGNFDDAQTAVKRLFASDDARERLKKAGFSLSSANSINWGRLVPQIAYYVSAYCDLLAGGQIEKGEQINFCVPTGNFGNILACWYAKNMGLPIKTLICASNSNNILTDFFASGQYDTRREFFKTMSPSMDILVSSNLERLVFEICGRDDALVAHKMRQLSEEGVYQLDELDLKRRAACFIGGFATEEDTGAAIANFYDVHDYLLDPHTGVAACVYDIYAEATGDETKTVLVSTASPFKFPADVYRALTGSEVDDPFKAQRKLASYTGEEIPEPLSGLKDKPVRFGQTIDKDGLLEAAVGFAESLK